MDPCHARMFPSHGVVRTVTAEPLIEAVGLLSDLQACTQSNQQPSVELDPCGSSSRRSARKGFENMPETELFIEPKRSHNNKAWRVPRLRASPPSHPDRRRLQFLNRVCREKSVPGVARGDPGEPTLKSKTVWRARCTGGHRVRIALTAIGSRL